MDYLKDIQTKIANNNYPGLLQLWEEYCAGDQIDPEELKQILNTIKASTMAESFGKHVDKALPLWQNLEESPIADKIFELIFDLQTINSENLRKLAYDYLHAKFGSQKSFSEKIRLIGLRNKDNFQHIISNFLLLNHMDKGRFVFHTAGWGVGEIVELSLIREQLVLEFDYVAGKKDLSFENAFKTLLPIPDDHFLALRFGSPDKLEEKARKNPLEVIHMLLRDLGPKSAGEIKDELYDLVIPSTEWTKWWQNTRAKIKKDTMIESPEELKEPFRLRTKELSHEAKLTKAIEDKPDANTLIEMVYSFLRDFPETLKNKEFKTALLNKLMETLSFQEISDAQELQIRFFVEDMDPEQAKLSPELIKSFKDLEETLKQIPVLSFKKRACVEIRAQRSDWQEIFLNLLFSVDQNTLRDYLLTELLNAKQEEKVSEKLQALLVHPSKNPEFVIWYFQKAMQNENIPLSDAKGKSRCFEALLVLLSHIEGNPNYKDLVKKIHGILEQERYLNIRKVMQGSSLEEVKEFLLLATKCHSLTSHDVKIFHSLAEVVYPTLGKKGEEKDQNIIWCTPQGYKKTQERIHQIATVETVENAKEIEVARSHGDLRENAEFKSALEKRDRLQGELKFLSEQLNRARIMTQDDISTDEAGIGTIIDCEGKDGKAVAYTILGPWEANPEENILSFQSKIAQAMTGKKVGQSFEFQNEEYKIKKIRSYLEKK